MKRSTVIWVVAVVVLAVVGVAGWWQSTHSTAPTATPSAAATGSPTGSAAARNQAPTVSPLPVDPPTGSQTSDSRPGTAGGTSAIPTVPVPSGMSTTAGYDAAAVQQTAASFITNFYTYGLGDQSATDFFERSKPFMSTDAIRAENTMLNGSKWPATWQQMVDAKQRQVVHVSNVVVAGESTTSKNVSVYFRMDTDTDGVTSQGTPQVASLPMQNMGGVWKVDALPTVQS